MSDMDSDEENNIRYGTPLEPYEEDEVPSKRKYQQQPDQYAVDAHGRRRFHGAFTGGFSAGYGNTVGTPEGWTPTNFKSSRSNKASFSDQKPEDFMDEEDKGEYGIAPRQVQTHNEFSGQKRPKQRQYHDGPIPGEPVLTDLIRAVHETVAVRMLRSMGWKEGQGAGDRVTITQKKKAKEQHKVYGCYMPDEMRQDTNQSDDSSEDSEFDYETLFAPDDYEPYILIRKNDRFGLGYSGLSRHSVLGAMSGEYGEGSSSTSHLMMKEKGKKVSIRGQAFGVGAFETEDDDIYGSENMSHYDFAIGGPADAAKRDKKADKPQSGGVLDGFVKSTKPLPSVPSYPPPALPRDYSPVSAGTRRSRFEPTDHQQRDQGLGRHELTAAARGQLLGEAPLPIEITENTSNQTEKGEVIAKLTGRNVNFVSENKEQTENSIKDLTGLINKSNADNEDYIPLKGTSLPKSYQQLNSDGSVVNVPIIDLSRRTDSSNPDFISIADSGKPLTKVFKPFKSDPKKQARYEKYLQESDSSSSVLEKVGDMDKLSEWEKDREMAEFEQAAKLYRPLTGIIADRFTHASEPDDVLNPWSAVAKSKSNHGLATPEQIEAAKKGMYGSLTRTVVEWKPQSIVYKRFNVPEPGVARVENNKEDRPKVSYSIFSYLDTPVHDKDSFAKEQSKFSGSRSLRWDVKEPFSKSSTDKDVDKVTVNIGIKNKEDTKKDQHSTSSESKENIGFTKRMTTAELFLKESEKTEASGVEVTETINNFDKMDLYKSIFLSDSEEEDKIDVKDGDKPHNLDADFIDRPKNVERNTSPPRGIFANIDFDELNSWRSKAKDREAETIDNKKHEIEIEKPVQEKIEEVYGPKIPENLQKRLQSENDTIQPNSNNEVHEIDSSSDDSWVDANEVKKAKLKKKKSKKKKSKGKKSKKKDKKER